MTLKFDIITEFPSSLCTLQRQCDLCTFDKKYEEACEKKDLKSFFQNIVSSDKSILNPSSVKLKEKTPEKGNVIPENCVEKLYWKDQFTNYALCNMDGCNTVISFPKSATRGIYRHIDSHSNRNGQNRGKKRGKISERPFDELSIKQRMSLVIALKLIGQNKLSAFKCTSDAMVSTYQAVLLAAGVDIETEDLVESRRQIIKTVNCFAEKIRNIIKEEINGQSVTFVHDDTRSKCGLNEAIRAVTACFVKDNVLVRRFVHLEYVEDKDSHSVAESIRKIAEEYGVADYQIAADGASTNLAAANILKLIQHTCWSHTVHNIVEAAFQKTKEKYTGFREFYKVFEKMINKAARRHLNAKLANEEGFIKIPTLSCTRWLSRRDCFNSIIRNWQILENNKSNIGLNDCEWKLFDNFKLFQDIHHIIEVATSCLLRFEVQQQTSSHTVIPTVTKWIYKMLAFTMDENHSQLGRLLAKELIDQIDLYCFGRVGSQVKPRIHSTHVVQAALHPETHLLHKIKSKISTNHNAIGGAEQIKSANDSIDLRFYRIYDRVWIHLKESYKRIYLSQQSSPDLENSNSSNSDFDISSLGELSQEQQNKLQNHFKKKEDEKLYFSLKTEFKKFKLFVKEYKTWEENKTGEAQFSALIRQYNLMKVNRKDTHILFWTLKDVKLTFPILHRIIMDTIHVPASNAAVESLFSHVTDVKNFKRSCLSDKNLNDILTLYYSDLYMDESITNFFKSNVNK